MGRVAWMVIAAVVVLTALLIAVGSLLDWWDWKTLIGWRALVGYIRPEDATGRKDTVQVYAVIVAGSVAAVTAAVGLVNLYYTRKNLNQQREIEIKRAEDAARLEAQRAQGSALQAYYEQMGKLLTEHELRNTSRGDIKLLARGQTLTVLKEVDATGKGSLLTFLQGAGLIQAKNPAIVLNGAEFRGAYLGDVDLKRANLEGANLTGAILKRARLYGANLTGALLYRADLTGAGLIEANLYAAILEGAILQGANLYAARLEGAVLIEVNLQGAILKRAILKRAILQEAILQEARLERADLTGADLTGAKGITEEQLALAFGDEFTKVPEDLRPKGWPPGEGTHTDQTEQD